MVRKRVKRRTPSKVPKIVLNFHRRYESFREPDSERCTRVGVMTSTHASVQCSILVFTDIRNFSDCCLRFLAHCADHEMSADWLAAGPRGRKNPEPGQRIVSLSSPTLLRLSSPTSDPSSSYSTSGRAGTSSFLAVLLRKVSSGGSTRLQVLLLHFAAACSQRHSSISGDRSILCAFPPSSLSGSLYRQRCHFFLL